MTTTRTGESSTFWSLKVRNYRLFFIGQLISVTGTWMQTVAQAFLVLHLTDSATDLGLSAAARFAPMFLFGPWGGVIADRLDRRRVLFITQSLSALLALAFGLLVATRVIDMAFIYLLATLLGVVNVFDNPARQSFISELVPEERLRNAVTLNSVTMNTSRVFGAAIGGASVAALGFAVCFYLNAASFLAVLLTLAMMRRSELGAPTKVARRRGQVVEGLRYVRSRPELLVPMMMIAIVGTLAWEFQVSLPLIADDTFHGGAGTYGTMASMMGLGAIVGGLVAASRSSPKSTALSLSALGWGVAIIAAALAPTRLTEYLAMLFVGYGSITFNTLAKTMLQLAAAPEMRGRVMALWALAWLGSTPIGGPIVGWVAAELGARWGLLIGGVPTVVIGLLTLPVLARQARSPALSPPDSGTRVGPTMGAV